MISAYKKRFKLSKDGERDTKYQSMSSYSIICAKGTLEGNEKRGLNERIEHLFCFKPTQKAYKVFSKAVIAKIVRTFAS